MIFSLVLPSESREVADTVYKNGKIYTVDENHPWVEAIAIQGDRFVFVGTNDGAESWIGPDTKVVDLDGKFVAPGFYDMHTHPDLLLEPKYTGGIQTLPLGHEELKKAILEFDKENPGDGWIFGGTWSPNGFTGEGVKPNAEYLDSFISDRPVAILDVTRHNLMVNTKAIELAGIDRDTFEPEHGTIEKDDDGNPTGLFSDGAQSLLSHVLPQANIMQLKEIYSEGQELLNSYGFVGTRSQHVNSDRLKAVQLLERDGALTIRYDMAISWKNDLHVTVPDRAELLTGERHRYNSQHVSANYIKFHYDGQPFSNTAVFLEPYRGTDLYGKFNETPEEMRSLFRQLDRQDIAANIHVVGDGAARAALDAIEDVQKITGTDGPRHMLAHTYFIHDSSTHCCHSCTEKKTHWKRGFIVRICCRKRFWFFNNWVNRNLKLDKLRRIHNVSFKHSLQNLCVCNITSWDFKPVSIKNNKVCVFAFCNTSRFVFAVHGPCSVNCQHC